MNDIVRAILTDTAVEINAQNLRSYYEDYGIAPAVKFVGEQLTVTKMKQLIDETNADEKFAAFIIKTHLIYRIKTDFIFLNGSIKLDKDENEIVKYLQESYSKQFIFTRYLYPRIVSCSEEFIKEDIRRLLKRKLGE